MTKFDSTPRILIVDDEVRLTESLESLASAMGFVCQVAHSGYDAQERLLAEEFDLIITDLLMPGISGLDLIDFASGHGLWTPIVVLTGQGTVNAAVQAMKQGAYDFVVKPFDPDRFRTVLIHALERSSYERKRLEHIRHTEQLQAEIRESKQYLELVLQSAEDVAIITTNREGKIKTFNTGAEKLFGAPLDQVLGQPIDLWFPNAKIIKHAHDFLNGQRREAWREELAFENLNASQLWIHVVMRWMESPSPFLAGLIVVATDITQRHILREKLKILSITDDLTGLYNQRYFYESLRREMERSNRRNAPFGLAMFDIDHFKRYNDEFGHLKGDEILRKLGEVMRSTIRRIDYGFRYGGDEFAVLLPETELEHAVLITERIRANTKAQFEGQVTLSIGVVQGKSPCDERRLIEAADRAMYESKRAGGDYVSFISKSLTLTKQ
ncbi:MAG: diguanylate cyclase [Acidobacteriia bacterium]|nr:diguanylate cyclase [Terriglobia bacterium]